MGFVELSPEQLKQKLSFINHYIQSSNNADGSKLDANANVSSKNIATLSAEVNKDINIQINRTLISKKIEEEFGTVTSTKYLEDLNQHNIYVHDETSLFPYCVSISMYPFFLEGLKGFGGESRAPKHLSSYNGSFVNMLFGVSSQFAGAVATCEYLIGFDHFARKDYGDDYLQTHRTEITQELQQVVFAANQPASARNYQSVFWNISIYDEKYFDSMFGNFYFPDGTKPEYQSLKALQEYFMSWFNEERSKAVLTFPVVTAACINDGSSLVDKEFENFITKELAEGNAFFIFTSPNAYALSSCCRLKNDVSDSINDFSYSLGAGGVMTGSMNVITLNLPKLGHTWLALDEPDTFLEYLSETLKDVYKYQVAFKRLFKDYKDAGLLPVYDNNFITMEKQYLTIGINGMVELAEMFGFTANNNEAYKDFVSEVLQHIANNNKEASKRYHCKFNTEFVPAENLGVKFAKWNTQEGIETNSDCYNSYLYRPEDDNISIVDKFVLHGRDTSQYLDGGSALHLNLEYYPTPAGFKKLLDIACKEGCEYFCFNVRVTVCEDCGYINKQTKQVCTECSSTNVSWATRVIGYLKKIKNFSRARQEEEAHRAYHKC